MESKPSDTIDKIIGIEGGRIVLPIEIYMGADKREGHLHLEFEPTGEGLDFVISLAFAPKIWKYIAIDVKKTPLTQSLLKAMIDEMFKLVKDDLVKDDLVKEI